MTLKLIKAGVATLALLTACVAARAADVLAQLRAEQRDPAHGGLDE